MITLLKKKGFNLQTKEELYYPIWTRNATVTETQLSKRMARGSTFSVGEINGVFNDFPQSIIDELLNGNAVSIDGLGLFKLKVQGKSQKEKKLVTSAGCKISVVFEPAAELLSRIEDEREFRFVEVPTKEGQQDVNEGTGSPDSSDGGENGDDNGGTTGDDPDQGGTGTIDTGGGTSDPDDPNPDQDE